MVKKEMMFRKESEQGVENSIQSWIDGGWILVSMSYTGDFADDGYKEIAFVYSIQQ